MATTDTSLFYDIAANKANKDNTNSSTASKKNSDLDKDAFLRLLVTQLQYQDPLDPMDNTEFVSQMAQFSALEQMNNLNNTMTNSQAYGMIGRTVFAKVYNETKNVYEDISGTVDSITIKKSGAYLNIGDKEVPYSDVQQVYSTDVNTSIDRNLVVSQALSLVGKSIQAITIDDKLEAKDFVEGKVDYVKFIDDVPVLSVGGKDVHTYEVISVSDNTLLKGQTLSAEVYKGDNYDKSTVTGPITDVSIGKDSVFLTIDGQKVEVKDVTSVLNSLAYVGKEIKYNGKVGDKEVNVAGKVDSVIIKDKECYLVVGDEEVPVSKL